MSEYKLPLDKLIPALLKFQAECPSIPKDKENPFFKNKDTGKKAMYADLATIIEITKDARTRNGLAFTQVLSGPCLITYLFHESGQQIMSEITMTKDPKSPQAFGSELTYARRYALSAILGVAAEDDDDGNGASGPPATNKNTPASTTTPPAAAKPPTSEAGTKNDGPVMANAAQISQIGKKAKALGWSTEDLTAELALSYDSPDGSKTLTMEKAKLFLETLNALLDAKKPVTTLGGITGTDVTQD